MGSEPSVGSNQVERIFLIQRIRGRGLYRLIVERQRHVVWDEGFHVELYPSRSGGEVLVEVGHVGMSDRLE